MKTLAERIATKLESVFCGLYAVHDLLVKELDEALKDGISNEYLPYHLYNVIDSIYPQKSVPQLYTLNLIAEEMQAYEHLHGSNSR